MFKITSESSVAAGVRRIEAVTGLGVLNQLKDTEALVAQASKELKVQKPAELAKRAAQLQAEMASMKKEIEALNAKIASSKLDDIMKNAVSVKDGKVTLVTAKVDMAADVARSLADEIKGNYANCVALLAICDGDKLNFLAVAGKDAVAAGAHAGKLVGAVAAITGGKGGGRPDNAMAGGKDASKIADALAAAAEVLTAQIK
jgi:alanyl-tRNA synthetase